MRLHELAANLRLPKSYPLLAVVHVENGYLHRFKEFFEDTDNTRIIEIGASDGDATPVCVACSDEETKDRIEDAWGY